MTEFAISFVAKSKLRAVEHLVALAAEKHVPDGMMNFIKSAIVEIPDDQIGDKLIVVDAWGDVAVDGGGAYISASVKPVALSE